MMPTMSKSEIEALIKKSLEEIEQIFCKNKCFFLELADLATFLNIRSLKRKSEYHALCYMTLSRRLHRIAIENLNMSVEPIEYTKTDSIIPRNLLNSDRLDMATENNVKNYYKEALNKILNLYYEDVEKYKEIYMDLFCSGDSNALILAYFAECQFKDMVCAVKKIERKIIDMESVSWSTLVIKGKDKKEHDRYKKKLKRLKI